MLYFIVFGHKIRSTWRKMSKVTVGQQAVLGPKVHPFWVKHQFDKWQSVSRAHLTPPTCMISTLPVTAPPQPQWFQPCHPILAFHQRCNDWCAHSTYNCNPTYRSLHTPEPRNPKKSQKGLSRPHGPECPKSDKKVPKDPKKSQKGVKISVWGPFRHFFDTSGKNFLRLFCDLGPEGLGTPVYGGSNRNTRPKDPVKMGVGKPDQVTIICLGSVFPKLLPIVSGYFYPPPGP